MSLSTTASVVQYTGNGSAETFTYPFRILDQDHLVVTVIDSFDEETVLDIGDDYTVTGVGNSSGSVVLVDDGQDYLDAEGDLDTGFSLIIRRVVPLTQLTDIRNEGDYYAETHEDVFDQLVMADQQQQVDIDKSLKAAANDDSALDMTLPPAAERASGVLGFDADGQPIVYAGTIPSDVTVSAFGETLVDDTDAAAARVTLGGVPTLTGSEVFTNKTLTAPLINGGTISGTQFTVRAIATASAIAATDDVVLVSTAVTVTLPAASASVGKVIRIKKTDSGTVTVISRAGSDTIDGLTSISMGTQYDFLTLVGATSSAWSILDFGISIRVGANRITSDITTVADTPKEIVLNQERFDALGLHSTTTGRVTVAVPGKYSVRYGFEYGNGGTAASAVQTYLQVNGTGTKYASWETTGNANSKFYTATGGADIQMAAGDYVSAWVLSGGQSVTLPASTDDVNYLYLTYLGR